jgi:hypothetical protein
MQLTWRRFPSSGRVLGIQETTAKRVDCGGEIAALTSTEPGDRRKAAAGLSVHKFPFREVSPKAREAEPGEFEFDGAP